jgi:hypothetical protein
MRAPLRWLVLLALIVTSACAADGGWRGTIEDSAGVAIVSNPDRGIWTAPPAVVREVDIGGVEGDSAYQFGQIASIAVGVDSAVYVLDAQSRDVRVFDAAGRFTRRFGRPGTGPGELSQGAAAVIVVAGDTVLVPDILQQRITHFAPDGEPVATTLLPMSGGVSVRWATTPDGLLVQQTRAFPMGSATPSSSGDFLLLRDRHAQVLDTLLALPAGRSVQFQTGALPRMRLFDSEPVWILTSDGRIALGINTEYSIGIYTRDGTLERIIRRPSPQRPVTQADRDAFLRFLREGMTAQGVPPDQAQPFLDNVGFADFYPAFAALLGGPDASLWVQRIQTAEDVAAAGGEFDAQDVGSPTWDVFDANGRYLGPIELPARFTPLIARGDRLWGIWRDDLDVQHVLRLRVTGVWTAGPTAGA